MPARCSQVRPSSCAYRHLRPSNKTTDKPVLNGQRVQRARLQKNVKMATVDTESHSSPSTARETQVKTPRRCRFSATGSSDRRDDGTSAAEGVGGSAGVQPLRERPVAPHHHGARKSTPGTPGRNDTTSAHRLLHHAHGRLFTAVRDWKQPVPTSDGE